MNREVINFTQKFSLFDDRWKPRVIAEMNDYQFKIAKIEGDFVWHDHQDTDEAFIVIDGKCCGDVERRRHRSLSSTRIPPVSRAAMLNA